MTRFSLDILLPFPNSNDLNSHECTDDYCRIQKQLTVGKCTAGYLLTLKRHSTHMLWLCTMDHNILIYKFDYYGVRDVAKYWFHSYLENQIQQAILLNGSNLSIKIISTGVHITRISFNAFALQSLQLVFRVYSYRAIPWKSGHEGLQKRLWD